MKVNIPDKKSKEPTAEMTGGSGEVGQIVSEMLTEPAKLADFGFTPDIVARANAIKTALNDDEPFLSVVRVEEGWSRSRRLWPAREIDRIVAQTNELEPVGHLGHIKDEDHSTAMPEPQTTWVGAIAKTEPSQDKTRVGEMVRVAYFAGYNHPGAKIRNIIRARAVRGISWAGKSHQVPIPGKGVEIREFDLQMLDWARKGSEGMPTSNVVAITQEMEGGEMPKELAQVTPEEYKQENPNGYALLRIEVEGESKALISEMEGKVEEGDKAKSLLAKTCELLGIDDPSKLEESVTALKSKVGDKAKLTVQAGIAAIVKEKVPGEDDDEDVKARRALLTRLLPVAEMESEIADTDEEGAKKKISEMVDEAFNTDETIKTVVGEMAVPAVRRREDLNGAKGTGLESNPYVGERERISVS